MISVLRPLSLVVAALAVAGSANAAPVANQNITHGVIFGTGNSNGDFVVDIAEGIELGLRAKRAFQGVTGSNGDGTFNQTVGNRGTNVNPLATWNFDWSINTNVDGASDRKLDDLTYVLGIDYDAGFGTNFRMFDLINQPFADHALGDNNTVQCTSTVDNGNDADGCYGKGHSSRNATEYVERIGLLNVSQNSWNLGFFDDANFVFDPEADGNYSIYLAAFDVNSMQLARTDITVIVGAGATAEVPEPASLALVGLALAGLAATRRKKA